MLLPTQASSVADRVVRLNFATSPLFAPVPSLPALVGSPNAYFIPISIGNRFYTSKRVRKIGEMFLADAAAAVIIPCDILKFFAYLAQRGISDGEAELRASRESLNVIGMLRNCGVEKMGNTRIYPMSNFYSDSEFLYFIDEFEKAVNSSRAASELDRLVDLFINQFYDPDERTESTECIQRQNVLHAAGMGIYVTEILGYRSELYKQSEGLLQTYLYEFCPDVLRSLLGKSQLDRQFVGLAAIL
jgi:hypothetical protein